jgi:outer membrane receptor protein involved in Fe transport
VNLGGRYRVTSWLRLVGQITNLFDRRYYTAAQLGAFGFTDSGAFIARPLPPIDGEFPIRHSTFYAPGAPIRAWVGTRFTF